MQVVWHGNYLKYFEDGREAFGLQYELEYLDMYGEGFFTPIVKSNIDFKAPLKYGDRGLVETRFVNIPAAKIIFDYQVFNEVNGQLLVTGQTTQVFLDKNMTLQLINPDFFLRWKKKWGLD